MLERKDWDRRMQRWMKNPYPKVGRRMFMTTVRSVVAPADVWRVGAAYALARYGHLEQYRDEPMPDGSRRRYFEHPRAVAWMMMTELEVHRWKPIVEALLHDTIEDSFILDALGMQQMFGSDVALGLRLVSKRPKTGFLSRLRQYGVATDLIVKLCDRIHNLLTLSGRRVEKQRRCIAESRRAYVPLADLLIAKLPKSRKWQGEFLKYFLEAAVEHAEWKRTAAPVGRLVMGHGRRVRHVVQSKTAV